MDGGGAKGTHLSHPKALAWLSPHSPQRHPGDPMSAWACLVSVPFGTSGLRLLIPRKPVPQNRSQSRTLPSPPARVCVEDLVPGRSRPPCLQAGQPATSSRQPCSWQVPESKNSPGGDSSLGFAVRQAVRPPAHSSTWGGDPHSQAVSPLRRRAGGTRPCWDPLSSAGAGREMASGLWHRL